MKNCINPVAVVKLNSYGKLDVVDYFAPAYMFCLQDLTGIIARMDDTTSRPHLIWIDLVCVVSVVWFIQIHVASPLLYNWGDIKFSAWAGGDIYDALARACIPLFFMASGFLLLDKPEPLLNFFGRRARKVLIPFLVWSAFYWFFMSDVRPEGAHLKDLASTFFPRLLAGPTMYHLWFLYPLLGFYLLVPVLRALVISASKRILWYLVGFWFVTSSLLPLLEKFSPLTIAPEFGFVTSYLGYFILGYLLGKRDYPPKLIWISAAAYLFVSALMTYGTFDLTRNYQILDDYWLSFLSPLVIIQSVLVFVGFKTFSYRFIPSDGVIARSLKHIAETSFGIYLVHVASLEWLRQIGMSLFKIRFTSVQFGNPWYGIPVITLVAFLFSFGLIRVMRRIPIVKEIVP